MRISQSVDAIDERVRRDVLGLAAVGLAALAFGLLFAWVLASTLSRPLRGLAAAARRVESGDLEARAEPGGASEQREVAEAFNDMTDRLERVLAAQREFVANASHQLRTPLTGLRLRIEAAGLKADDPALGAELDAAEREAERLARLVTSLLALAREGEQPGPAPPRCRWPTRPAPPSSAGSSRLTGATGVSSARETRTSSPLASEEDVAIVLDNLIENALHYSPPGTQVAVHWRRDADRAVLTVADEGPGLAPGEEAQRLRAVRTRERRAAELRGAASACRSSPPSRSAGADPRRSGPARAAEREARIELPGAPSRSLPTLDRELDRALPGAG